MSWLALSLELEAGRADALADALLEAGALSVEITDAAAGTPQERPIFGEPGRRSRPHLELEQRARAVRRGGRCGSDCSGTR